MENEEKTVARERKHFVRDLICNVDVSNAQFRSKTAVLVVLFAVLCQPVTAIVVWFFEDWLLYPYAVPFAILRRI